MAMVRAYCTCKQCGKDFTQIGTTLSGNEKSWRKWAKEHYTLCPECYEKEKEAREGREAEKIEKNYGLPAMTGTEKQVAWARKIRKDLIPSISKECDELFDIFEYDDTVELSTDENVLMISKQDLSDVFDYIKGVSSAKWYIENRDEFPQHVLINAYHELAAARKEQEEQEMLGDSSSVSFTLRPENCDNTGVVKTLLMPDYVDFVYEKDYDFIDIMRAHECEWTGKVWRKNVTVCTPPAEDLVAEIGADLVEHGFIVEFPSQETMAAAESGTYEAEHHRWIYVRTSGEYKGWFSVRWPGKNRSLYDAARGIKGSRYDSPRVVVPATRWKEVLDFCDEYDFRPAPSAQAIIDERQEQLKNAKIMKKKTEKPAAPVAPKVTDAAAVLEDLTDDD